MDIPDFNYKDELPAGEYAVALDEVNKRFGGFSPTRIELMKGLKDAVINFKVAGIKRIWVDGSFVTSKLAPKDIDGCWEYTSDVDIKRLDPVFLSTTRKKMKAKYGLDFFPAYLTEGATGLPFPKFFQVNRDGEAKGILIINL